MQGSNPIEDQVRCEFNGAVFYIPRKLFSIMVLRCQYPEKKFVRYKEGAVEEVYRLFAQDLRHLF